MAFVSFDPAVKAFLGDERLALDDFSQTVGQSARKTEHGVRRRVGALNEFRSTLPADFHAATQEGLDPGHGK